MDVSFVLPTISTDAMTHSDQRSLLRTQSIAVIVAAYLDHAARVYAKDPNDAYRYTRQELVDLINDVQTAVA